MAPTATHRHPPTSRWPPGMGPLRVTAHLAREVANPKRPPALDGLLAFAQAVFVEGREPPDPSKPMPPVDISHAVAPSPCGRYHLASFALAEVEHMERNRFVNRRFPIAEAQYLGGKIGTLGLSGGPAKSFRIPLETGWLTRDRVDWFCVGDAAAIRELLSWVTHLGKRRAVGLGKVRRWEVAACEAWGDGFPVIQDARPLRNLPLDAMDPEVGQHFEGYATLSFPYFQRHREELCLVAEPLRERAPEGEAAGLPEGLDAFLPPDAPAEPAARVGAAARTSSPG